jgi:hypothetical protein
MVSYCSSPHFAFTLVIQLQGLCTLNVIIYYSSSLVASEIIVTPWMDCKPSTWMAQSRRPNDTIIPQVQSSIRISSSVALH